MSGEQVYSVLGVEFCPLLTQRQAPPTVFTGRHRRFWTQTGAPRATTGWGQFPFSPPTAADPGQPHAAERCAFPPLKPGVASGKLANHWVSLRELLIEKMRGT